MIKYFLTGFSVKAITGIDDMMTHVPVISSVTRTRQGKIAFSIGIFSAILLAIVFAVFFSSLIKMIPYYRFFLAGVIFVLAFLVYSDFLRKKEAKKAEKRIKKISQSKKISHKRFFRLFLTGFVTSFATVIDDALAYSPALIGGLNQRIFGIAGIISATLIQILIIIYFSKKISKIKHRNIISAAGLVIVGILIIFGII